VPHLLYGAPSPLRLLHQLAIALCVVAHAASPAPVSASRSTSTREDRLRGTMTRPIDSLARLRRADAPACVHSSSTQPASRHAHVPLLVRGSAYRERWLPSRREGPYGMYVYVCDTVARPGARTDSERVPIRNRVRVLHSQPLPDDRCGRWPGSVVPISALP
jgi:hypothetical protein